MTNSKCPYFKEGVSGENMCNTFEMFVKVSGHEEQAFCITEKYYQCPVYYAHSFRCGNFKKKSAERKINNALCGAL